MIEIRGVARVLKRAWLGGVLGGSGA